MKIKTLKLNINNEQMAIFSLMGIVVSLLFAYAYFINASVLYVVERKTAEKESVVVLSRISDMETEYFRISEGISISLAHSLGFQEAEKISFADRKSVVRRAVTLNNR